MPSTSPARSNRHRGGRSSGRRQGGAAFRRRINLESHDTKQKHAQNSTRALWEHRSRLERIERRPRSSSSTPPVLRGRSVLRLCGRSGTGRPQGHLGHDVLLGGDAVLRGDTINRHSLHQPVQQTQQQGVRPRAARASVSAARRALLSRGPPRACRCRCRCHCRAHEPAPRTPAAGFPTSWRSRRWCSAGSCEQLGAKSKRV